MKYFVRTHSHQRPIVVEAEGGLTVSVENEQTMRGPVLTFRDRDMVIVAAFTEWSWVAHEDAVMIPPRATEEGW